MKNLLIFSILFVSHIYLNAQVITRKGNPKWIEKQAKLYYSNKVKTYQTSREIVNSKILDFKKQMKDSISLIGISIETELNINNSGSWEKINDSLNVWSLKISSENAPYLFLVFDKFKIPQGNEMYIYNTSRTILMGPFTGKNNPDGGCYATDIIEDSELIIEYHQNTKKKVDVELSISRIIHGLISEKTDSTTSLDACHNLVDVNCTEGDGWDDQKNGTCFILKLGNCSSPETSGFPWASASLINNTNNDNTPYIFTAWHNTQGSGSDLSLWIFRFKYWNINCGSDVNSATISYCGGQVLEKWENDGTNNDVALILMNEKPDASDNVFYCGWNRSTSTPSSSVLISHPDGGVMKITKSNSVSSDDLWWRSEWYVGGVSSGCSGGPLFDSNKRIIGSHHGRYSSLCSSDGSAGKLSYSWNTDGKGGNKISKWLDPNSSGVTTLDGKYRCIETEIVNRTINSDETINGCDIKVYNVTIQNNVDVIIDAERNVTFEKNFEVKFGSTLEIK